MKAHISKPELDPSDLYDECLQAYEEYKTFINYSDMPKFILKFDDQLIKDHTRGITDYNNGVYSISLSPELTTIKEDIIRKSVYYHEFTHIKDAVFAKQLFSDPKIINNRIKVYTEFHASRIETMVLFKFENSNQNKIIHSNDTLIHPIKREEVTVSSFLFDKYIDERLNIKCKINEINKADNQKDKVKLFLEALHFALYYLGTLDLCAQYGDNSLDNYKAFIPYTEIFGNVFKVYYENLQNTRKPENNKLRILNDNELEMMRVKGLMQTL